MAWSTRQLADLAGTTVNTIRHYHRLGILNEPERRYNGYKLYGVSDLVRLLRIRRLADLGIPLSHVGEATDRAVTDRDVLQQLDVELAAQIKKLTAARADIAAILRDNAPADSPAGFSGVASRLSEADSSILHIYGRLYDDAAMKDLQSMVSDDLESPEVGHEVDELAPDADEATRSRLAERLAPVLAQNTIDYPWIVDPASRIATAPELSAQTFINAVTELYNPAQLDVFYRASVRARELLAARNSDSDESAATPT